MQRDRRATSSATLCFPCTGSLPLDAGRRSHNSPHAVDDKARAGAKCRLFPIVARSDGEWPQDSLLRVEESVAPILFTGRAPVGLNRRGPIKLPATPCHRRPRSPPPQSRRARTFLPACRSMLHLRDLGGRGEHRSGAGDHTLLYIGVSRRRVPVTIDRRRDVVAS